MNNEHAKYKLQSIVLLKKTYDEHLWEGVLCALGHQIPSPEALIVKSRTFSVNFLFFFYQTLYAYIFLINWRNYKFFKPILIVWCSFQTDKVVCLNKYVNCERLYSKNIFQIKKKISLFSYTHIILLTFIIIILFLTFISLDLEQIQILNSSSFFSKNNKWPLFNIYSIHCYNLFALRKQKPF